MAMLGSDPQDMAELISKIATAIDQIQSAMGTLDSKAQSVRWEGPDAKRFKGSQWPQSKQQLNRVVADLNDVKVLVTRQKTQQENASA
ncbi:hypothetical protein ACFUCV_07415 [Specibacter sp. NPDC057265]|uniref:hypothetical protein n=1 Tax=Specibacter sp. NPDC057265 TaxID=3346075 RepID=UPI00363173B2